jgi:hypothetical protein
MAVRIEQEVLEKLLIGDTEHILDDDVRQV